MMQKLLRFRKIWAVLAIVSGTTALSSCEKEEDIIPAPSYSIATNFVGEYEGISSCDTGVAIFVINAGPDQTKVTIPASFGDDDCRVNTKVTATIVGNTLTTPTTSFTDLCFQDYTVKLDATRVNDSLFLTAVFTTPLGNASCSYMGKKIK